MAFKFDPDIINEGNAGLGKSLQSIKAAAQKISECNAGLNSRIHVDIPDVGEEAGKIGTCSRAIGNIYMDYQVANAKTNKTAASLNIGDTITLDVDTNNLTFADRISSNAYDASTEDFIPEGNVFNEYWADEKGQLQFTKREDGTYLVTKNGIPMGYTDQKGFDSIVNTQKPETQKPSETEKSSKTSSDSTWDEMRNKLKNRENLSPKDIKKLYNNITVTSSIKSTFTGNNDFYEAKAIMQDYLNAPVWDEMQAKIDRGEELTANEQAELFNATSFVNTPKTKLSQGLEGIAKNGVFATNTKAEHVKNSYLSQHPEKIMDSYLNPGNFTEDSK